MSTDTELTITSLPRVRAWLVVLGFVAMTATGPLLWLLGPAVKSRAAKPWPEWSTEAFLQGRYTEELRVHLRETSPITLAFRGATAELLYLAGLGASPVTMGTGGAMFNSFSVGVNPRALRDGAPRRVAFARELAAFALRHDLRVLVVVVPDKARVMPERLFEDARLPEPKASAYRTYLDEIAGAGLSVVDLAAAMQEWRAEQPELSLYHERDTHWTDAGAWRTARLVADRLREFGWLDGVLGEPILGGPMFETRSRHDLADLFGFLDHGLLAERLLDVRRSGTVKLAVRGAPSTGIDEAVPDSAVALCGDSFAAGGLAYALPAALGFRVDRVGAVTGGGPFEGLMLTLGRIARGEIGPRVVIWETIERSFLTSEWNAPPALPN